MPGRKTATSARATSGASGTERDGSVMDGGGNEAWKQDQLQASKRNDKKLEGFETNLTSLVESVENELGEIQTRYENELTELRRGQVHQLRQLLQEKANIEQQITQAVEKLSNAQHSMNHELQIALVGKMQECDDGEVEKDVEVD